MKTIKTKSFLTKICHHFRIFLQFSQNLITETNLNPRECIMLTYTSRLLGGFTVYFLQRNLHQLKDM